MAAQETWFGARVDPDFAEKRGDREPLHRPACRSVVVCLDEMGPEGPRASLANWWDRRPEAGGPAGDRLRSARWGLRLRCVPPRDRRGPHRAYLEPDHGQLGRLPGAGRGLDAGGSSGLRDRRQPQHRTARPTCRCSAGASALGVRVPAQVCRVPEPDRAVVEGAALAGAEGSPLRDLGRDLPRRSREAPPTGTSTGIRSSGVADVVPHAAAWSCRHPKSGIDL